MTDSEVGPRGPLTGRDGAFAALRQTVANMDGTPSLGTSFEEEWLSLFSCRFFDIVGQMKGHVGGGSGLWRLSGVM
ncbi:hypothetical protein V473_14605 [Sphingobium cupriresistens LL01]|uniref:Uncharacterized protein n=1 Tax=Sphingobium cupriresistens LL01 TaxID=1420583 RepID=A0A0J7XJM0_9SPHN|nr:hypothetical protein V473_22690 [Sphingobium cupriresistens LL01]KMS54679.1 hypothetical protein V473_14605 [Sphingobium cupriresistens LL01]